VLPEPTPTVGCRRERSRGPEQRGPEQVEDFPQRLILLERKKRILRVLPAISVALIASILLLPLNGNIKGALMGFCIGVSIVSLVKLNRVAPRW
jgi:hypothetical protein